MRPIGSVGSVGLPPDKNPARKVQRINPIAPSGSIEEGNEEPPDQSDKDDTATNPEGQDNGNPPSQNQREGPPSSVVDIEA